MSKPVTKSKIVGDGLRYQSKAGGSPFNGAGGFSSNTMSCFLCGTHRIRTTMTTRVLIGKAQAVCAPSCKTAKELDVAGAAAVADAVTS